MKTRNRMYGMLIGCCLLVRFLFAQPTMPPLEMAISAGGLGVGVCYAYLGRMAPCDGEWDPIDLDIGIGDRTIGSMDPELHDGKSLIDSLWGAFLGLGTFLEFGRDSSNRWTKPKPNGATDTIQPLRLEVLPQLPCIDIATGDILVHPFGEGHRLGGPPGKLPDAILQFFRWWNALGLPAVAANRPSFDDPIPRRFCRHEWMELTLSGEAQYRIEMVASMACIATLYTYGDPADRDSYVVISRREFAPGQVGEMAVHGIQENRPLALMLAFESGVAGDFKAVVYGHERDNDLNARR